MNFKRVLLSKTVLKNPYLWALFVRLSLLAFTDLRIAGDAGDYLLLARNIIDGHGFSRCPVAPFPLTAQRPPLYPYFLSFLSLFGMEGAKPAGVANAILDLGSMYFLGSIGRVLHFKSAARLPWIVALFPPMVGLSLYPLTESLSIFLFLGATLLAFRSQWVSSGLLWGALALCRSYMVLFAPLLAIFYLRQRKMSLRHFGKLIVSASLFPVFWVVRNYLTVGLLTFSQSAGASLQSYLGFCFTRFDWWHEADVKAIFGIPLFSQILNGQCLEDSKIMELGAQGWGVVKQCIAQNPLGAAGNWGVKELNGLFDWGRIFIYENMPELVVQLGYFAMILVWIRMVFLIRSMPLLTAQWKQARSYFLLTLIYLGGVTAPFGLDARYFLPPTLLALMLAVESAFCSASLNKLSGPLQR
jgi:hypothetical protein